MKKIIFSLVAIFALASCNHDAEVYTLNPQTKAVNDYNEAFVKTFGPVGSNVDWGFGSAKANTRANANEPEVVKKDVWKNFPEKLDGNTVPADVTEKEAAYVYEWFQKEENKGLTEEGQPWKNFFIQQVYGTMSQQKKGIWYRNNNEEFTDKGGMDYLTVGDGTTMTHVNDFNAETGGPWNIVYMKNSSAMKFGYHSSWDNSERQLFKLAKITVPGYCFDDGVAREGWYVGLSLLAEKYDNGRKVLGEQRKDWGDDWILKVVPGKGEIVPPTPATYRVIAEDLNASEASDFDFNDVVFDVEPNEAGTAAKIVVRAAGGIYKLTVAGQEVHKALGGNVKADGTYPMINTNPWNPDVKATLIESYSGKFDSDANIRNTIKSIVIKVYKPGFEENGIELEAQTGKPACKILVDQTFNVVTERTGIADENTNFHKYVGGTWDTETNGFWWKKN